MNRRALFAVLASLLVPAAWAQEVAAPPNVVLVYLDDVGWGDLGCFGSRINRTPRLDRLAREGLRLDAFYVAQPVCGASRASLLTGCYPNRIGIAGAPDHRSRTGIAGGELTLAEMLKTRGYATAMFGKWHLGCLPPFFPSRHGFDTWAGIPYSNDMWPRHPTARGYYPPLPFYRDDRLVETNPDQGRFTHDLTEDAIAFVRSRADRPFFCYLAHPMAHVPLHPGATFRGRSPRGLYSDVIEELDHEIGRLLDAIDEAGLRERTLVIVASDNGPWLSYGGHAGSSGPFREGKGTTFEGGVRVPFLARWPGRIPAGSRSSVPLMTIDVLPTLAALTGAARPNAKIDGRDASAVLLEPETASSPHEALFFWYRDNELQALRSGRWKLHFPHAYRTLAGAKGRDDGRPIDYAMTRCGLELYDLDRDPGETRDLAARHPEVVKRLQGLAEGARRELGDSLTGRTGEEVRSPGRVDD